MPSDHAAEVDELMAEYRRSREQLASVQRELSAITETARSGDDAVRVTVGPQGALRDLTITEDAYRRLRPSQLAATIVELADTATRACAARVERVLAPVLPARADPQAIVEGRADLDRAEVRPAAGTVSPAQDASARDKAAPGDPSGEEIYDQVSWLVDVSESRPRRCDDGIGVEERRSR